jgi:hypothetical protein
MRRDVSFEVLQHHFEPSTHARAVEVLSRGCLVELEWSNEIRQ